MPATLSATKLEFIAASETNTFITFAIRPEINVGRTVPYAHNTAYMQFASAEKIINIILILKYKTDSLSISPFIFIMLKIGFAAAYDTTERKLKGQHLQSFR